MHLIQGHEIQRAIPLCSNLHIPSGIGLTPIGVEAFSPGVQPAGEKSRYSSSYLCGSSFVNFVSFVVQLSWVAGKASFGLLYLKDKSFALLRPTPGNDRPGGLLTAPHGWE